MARLTCIIMEEGNRRASPPSTTRLTFIRLNLLKDENFPSRFIGCVKVPFSDMEFITSRLLRKRAKKRLQAEAVYARDSLGTGARVLGAALAIGMTVDDVEAWPERIGIVTVDAVNAAGTPPSTGSRPSR